MPSFKVGNILMEAKAGEALLFTANACVGADGRLVMGAGFAREVRDAYPGLDKKLGVAIQKKFGRPLQYPQYGLLLESVLEANNDMRTIGAFQTKYDWRDGSNLPLIAYSVKSLCEWLARSESRVPVHLNFPGVGLGGLTRAEVVPLLDPLPRCVTIWELPK